MEEWKDIKDFEGLYQVNNSGSIKNRHGKILKSCYDGNGYNFLTLCKNGKKYNTRIHQVVAEAFIPNTENKPQINHKDGNKLNNNDWNLEWCTISENSIHAFKHNLRKAKTGIHSNLAKLSENDVFEIRTLKDVMKQKQIADKFKISQQHVSKILNNVEWKHLI